MRTLFSPAVLLLCSACSGPAPQPQPAAPAAQPIAASQLQYPLPVKPFVAPLPWKPTQGDGPTVPPPNVSELTWVVLVDQYEPHQKPTPEWQPLPAAETVEIKMPPGSSLRCIAPPLSIEAEPEESGRSLESWNLAREVLCSGDGFRSFSAHPLRVRLLPDGKRELDYRSDGWLRERTGDGTVVHTQVSLRAEAPRRNATQGPPQLLSGTH